MTDRRRRCWRARASATTPKATPEQDIQLITTDGIRLITVTVVSVRPHSKRSQTVAAAIARTYLGPLRDPYAA